MTQGIILPPGVSIAIIAFLLSLLPASLFMWLWYLRRTDRSVAASSVALAFLLGLGLVPLAFFAEQYAAQTWQNLSPATFLYFSGSALPLQSLKDVGLAALGTFGIVAVIEEGLRYVVLRVWLTRSRVVDQVFDGLVIGIAMGIGFATLENTIYFWQQLQAGQLDTLVFIFFLRFLISTLAHISFGGLMGTLLTRGVFSLYNPRRYLLLAFWLPWCMHGLYDLFLSLEMSSYAILLLLPALIVLIAWAQRREFFIIHRKDGRLLVFQEAPQRHQAQAVRQFLKQFESPWNTYAPWLNERRKRGQLLDEISEPS